MNKIKLIVIISIFLVSIGGFAIAYSYLDTKLTRNSVGITAARDGAFGGEISPWPVGIHVISHEEFMLAMDEAAAELTDEEFRQAIEREFNPGGTQNITFDILDELMAFAGDDYIYERLGSCDRIFNVLFLGDDARIHQDRGRSDTIILISFNRDTGVIHLTSFMRDILIPTSLSGNYWNRINLIHSMGGPGRTINVLNNIFSLNIQRYAVVRFSGVFELVDGLGGLELYITEDEAIVLNRIFPDFPAVYAGFNLLNGRQVLAYSRMRIIDNDFIRTQRQRNVLKNILNKVLDTSSIGDVFTIANFVLDNVETNIPLNEILAVGFELFAGERPVIEELRIPIDESFTHGIFYDAYILAINFRENITALYEFIYGSEPDQGRFNLTLPYIDQLIIDQIIIEPEEEEIVNVKIANFDL